MGNIVAWALVQKTPGNDKTPDDDKPFVSPYGDRPVSATNPSHYRSHPSGIECIDVIRGLPFSAGNAIKYIWRAGQKDSTLQDLDKALWYVRDCIDNKIDFLAGDQTMDLFRRWGNKETDLDKIAAVALILRNKPAEAENYIKGLRYRASIRIRHEAQSQSPKDDDWPLAQPMPKYPPQIDPWPMPKA